MWGKIVKVLRKIADVFVALRNAGLLQKDQDPLERKKE